MKTWRDADHPTYLKQKRSTCYGCGCKCAKSAWGPWCHPCNVERMTRINKAMAGAARNIGEHDLADSLETDSARQRGEGVE